MLHIDRQRRHGLLGGADVRKCSDDWLDVCWQGCQHRVVEGEGEDAWEGGSASAANTGCRWVNVHVELLKKLMPKMGPSTSAVMKVKLHWCVADWLSWRWSVRALSGLVVMAAPLAAVSRRPCGEDGPGTSYTEAPVLARKRAPVEWSLRKQGGPGGWR